MEMKLSNRRSIPCPLTKLRLTWTTSYSHGCRPRAR